MKKEEKWRKKYFTTFLLKSPWYTLRGDSAKSILTWHRRYPDHEGGSPRARPYHCTTVWLTLAIISNVDDSDAQFVIVGVRRSRQPLHILMKSSLSVSLLFIEPQYLPGKTRKTKLLYMPMYVCIITCNISVCCDQLCSIAAFINVRSSIVFACTVIVD